MDRENVIRDLRYLKTFGIVSNNLQVTEIAQSALAMLKEQQKEIEDLKSKIQRYRYYGCFIPE